MKRFILLILCAMTLGSLYAQSQQELRFVYIAHDEETPTNRLCERLKTIYNDALELPENFAAIFYLANNSQPIIVKVNTKDDNPQDFPHLIHALQNSRYHDADPRVDVDKIIEILSIEQNDIITETGQPRYAAVEWAYYVNSTFWRLGLNESIIANLYWIFEMEQLASQNYPFISVWYPRGRDLGVNEKLPFGSKQLCKSMKFRPLQY